jgi:hypothetical protein
LRARPSKWPFSGLRTIRSEHISRAGKGCCVTRSETIGHRTLLQNPFFFSDSTTKLSLYCGNTSIICASSLFEGFTLFLRETGAYGFAPLHGADS